MKPTGAVLVMARRSRDAPLVLDAITDTSSGDLLRPSELPKRVVDVRLLLVGEEHTGAARARNAAARVELRGLLGRLQ
ncbi:MAG TPA: hypothetical protein VGL03_01525 [Thermoanaerobaculia bacterium]|jgi:hypothetical protein